MPLFAKNKKIYFGGEKRKWQPMEKLHFSYWKFKQKKTPVLKKPVFFIGCPRSGTSIAVRLFSQHPMVANWSEAGEVWDPYSFFDPDADHHWSAEKASQDEIKRLHTIFEYYRQKNKKTRFVNKHPRNSVRIDYIKKIFPDAYFIHVIRDGRAVVNSIVNLINNDPSRGKIPLGGFCKPLNWRGILRDDLVIQSAMQWRDIVKYICEKKDELGDHYYEYKYEEMCENPIDIFSSVYEFVGLPRNKEDLSEIPDQLTNMNDKYKKSFSSEQIESINAIQNELLRQLEYL